ARAPEPVALPSADGEIDLVGDSADRPLVVKEAVLVTRDQSGLGPRLVEALASDTLAPQLVDGTIEAIESAIEEITAAGQPLRGLLHTLSLDHPRADALDAAALNEAQNSGVRFAHRLFKSIVGRDWTKRPRVFFLTRGALP